MVGGHYSPVANLDFDARVPIPFSVFPSSYRSDAANHQQPAPAPVNEPEPVAYPVEHHHHHHHEDNHSLVDREDTRTDAPALPDPAVYGKEEVPQEFVNHQYIEEPTPSHTPALVHAPHHPEPEQPFDNQLDFVETEYRRRTSPAASVISSSNSYPSQELTPSYPQPFESQSVVSSSPSRVSYTPSQSPASSALQVYQPQTAIQNHPQSKMGYYDDDGNYHSFRRGVERAADRIMHPFHHEHHEHHHHSHSHPSSPSLSPSPSQELVVADNRRPAAPAAGGEIRAIERGGNKPAGEHVPIPCNYIRLGDILILQGRPCQVIRISVSPQTGQHRYLGVDLFTRKLQEESSFIDNPSPSVVVQTMLGPVYKTYRILDIYEDQTIVAMTESGDVRQGLQVVPQGDLFNRIRKAYGEGRGSVRAVVINDAGRELVVDYKVIHASRL
ncbi:putative Woronin body protein HexA [Aspergillus glaucus CBS 516.65]|uniref:Translation initiation factor 5A C-terminal domain-containing protein n=1 Tax=Aspergillus glaucus CBS 516.65 TaxID=1160497 RepID=A0A1L9VGM8_ASPGL|nr:hypothetical protein ASPGLDRAFT_36503 [Aspergillus glaucus CBS 516.65]OJJ83035.1 hypothetical protein ASPGLDRAFT_36503 [Aspergillus glaucus CBS 516.65]